MAGVCTGWIRNGVRSRARHLDDRTGYHAVQYDLSYGEPVP